MVLYGEKSLTIHLVGWREVDKQGKKLRRIPKFSGENRSAGVNMLELLT